jgi:hypothetical protein
MVKRFDFKIFLNLIRSLFPNWNFFDQTAFAFSLKVKTNLSEQWSEIDFEKKRSWVSLFFNAELNENLAQYSVIEQFARDIQQNLNLGSDLVTFKMVASLLAFRISEIKPLTKNFQFKLIASNEIEQVEIFQSEILQMDQL